VPMRKVAGENIVEAFVMETEKLLADIQNQPQINTDLSNTIESVLLNQR